jgi:hypothetical protein
MSTLRFGATSFAVVLVLLLIFILPGATASRVAGPAGE